MIIGIRTLSFIGKGRTSTVIAIAAPARATSGFVGRKNIPAKNAKKNPANEPSQVFPLLNGKESDAKPPNSDAALSPRQNMAIAA